MPVWAATNPSLSSRQVQALSQAVPAPTLPGFTLPGKDRPPLLWDPQRLRSSLEILERLPDLFVWYRACSRSVQYGFVSPHIPRVAALSASMLPVLEQARRQVASSLLAQIDAAILTAFPRYSLEDLQAMPIEDLLELYAHAEWSIRTLRGIPLSLVTPTGEEIGQPPPMPNAAPPQQTAMPAGVPPPSASPFQPGVPGRPAAAAGRHP